MLQVVIAETRFEDDMSRGVVVIESDQPGPPFHAAFNELDGAAAVHLAQQYASTRGCAPAMLNGNKNGPYAVNSEGKSLDQVTDAAGRPLPPTDPKMQPVRYRIEVPITRPIR